MKQVRVGRQRVVLGSCLEGMRRMEPGSVDVVCTSPPYNIGVKYGTHHDRMSDADYLGFLGRVARGIRHVLKPNGSVFVNVGHSGKFPWVSHDVANVFRRFFVLQNRVAWIKSITVDDVTRGQFKPLNSPRFLNNTFEDLYHFTLDGNASIDKLAIGVPNGQKNVARFNHKTNLRCRGNSWFVPYRTVNSRKQKFFHPAAFPETLPEMCIQLHGGKNLLVLDPFLGTGTTLVAAQNLGHRGIGFDIDKTYARVAVRRLRASMQRDK